MATISFTTKFDLRNTPKIYTFEDTTDYVGQGIALANVNGSFKITAPSGAVVYNNTNYSNAGCDIRNSVSRINQLVINLPLASDGFPESGLYTIVYTVADITGATIYHTVAKSYTYKYTRPKIAITQKIDCVSPLFTSTDATNYVVEGITPTIVRQHSISYPVGSASAGTPTTGTGLTVTSSTFYNGTQTSKIISTLTYTFADGLIILDEITGVLEVLVNCTDTCAIYCCVRSIEQQMIAYSTTNAALYATTRTLFTQIMSLVGMVVLARNCGKGTDISGYLSSIKLLANCTDDCDCSGVAPTQVYGLAGLVNSVVVVSGGTPITVTAVTVGNTTTYTVTFSASLLATINSLYNTVVASGYGTSVSSATVGITTTYTVATSLVVTSQSATNAFVVPSANGTTITGISATVPATGTYLVFFEADYKTAGVASDITYRLMKDAIALTSDRKQILPASNQLKMVSSLQSFSLNAGQVITANCDSITGGTIEGRSITIIRIA